MRSSINVSSRASDREKSNRSELQSLWKESPLPENEALANLGLFLSRQELTKILFFNELYQKILNLHGVLMEFGTRWGRNVALWNNLRGLHEPFNYNRRFIAFDTFEGFKNIHSKDGSHEILKEGNFGVTEEYENYLLNILHVHENESPLNHVKKNVVLKGDAPAQLKDYLEKNPQTLIALAWFDFDLFQPTKDCLELIQPFLQKGAIIGFDELNDPMFPGETTALREFIQDRPFQVFRNRYSAAQSYIVWDHP